MPKQNFVRFLSRVNLILPLGIVTIKNKIFLWQMGTPQAVFIFLIFQSTLNTMTQPLMMNYAFLFRMKSTQEGFKPQSSWVTSRHANHWAMICTYALFICKYYLFISRAPWATAISVTMLYLNVHSHEMRCIDRVPHFYP